MKYMAKYRNKTWIRKAVLCPFLDIMSQSISCKRLGIFTKLG